MTHKLGEVKQYVPDSHDKLATAIRLYILENWDKPDVSMLSSIHDIADEVYYNILSDHSTVSPR